MKKIFLLLVLLIPGYIAAMEEYCCSPEWWQSGWEAEVRVAYFYPTSHAFREIYKGGRTDYQIEIAKQICNNFSVWTSIDFLSKKGYSDPLRDGTHVHLTPLSLGVKYLYPISSCISVYAGLGGCYTWFRVKNDSPFVRRHVNKEAFGLVVKTGIRYDIACNVFLDLFTDYFYQPFHFHGHHGNKGRHVDVGGFKFGAGLGYAF